MLTIDVDRAVINGDSSCASAFRPGGGVAGNSVSRAGSRATSYLRPERTSSSMTPLSTLSSMDARELECPLMIQAIEDEIYINACRDGKAAKSSRLSSNTSGPVDSSSPTKKHHQATHNPWRTALAFLVVMLCVALVTFVAFAILMPEDERIFATEETPSEVQAEYNSPAASGRSG